jgi:DNA-binding transcriptional LysR family regulator
MIDFKNLETLYWVANLASFRRAAERLHTTQPAISQRVAQIEAELGFPLLRRGSKSVTPTPRGREVLIYAEKLLAMRAEMIGRLGSPLAVAGVLRIGVAETIVHSWLPDFIKRVNLVFPKLVLEIEVDISPNLRDRLLAQEIDLAFLLDPFASAPFVTLPLCRYPPAFIASKKIRLPREPARIEDLALYPIMTFSRRTTPYDDVRRLFSHPGLPGVQLHASASLATLVHMAEEGLGIAVIPSSIVRKPLASGRLRQIRTDITLPDLCFSACWIEAPDMLAPERVARLAAETAAKAQD